MGKRSEGLVRAGQMPLLTHIAAEARALTPVRKRRLDSAAQMVVAPATAEDACFVHAVLCQVGMRSGEVLRSTALEPRNDGSELIRVAAVLTLRFRDGFPNNIAGEGQGTG